MNESRCLLTRAVGASALLAALFVASQANAQAMAAPAAPAAPAPAAPAAPAPAAPASSAAPAPIPALTPAALKDAAPSEPLGAQNAVLLAIRNNPALEASLLSVSQAKADVRAEEGLYSPVLRGSAGVTHTESPGLRTDAVSVTSSDTIDLGAGLRKQFSTGTIVDLDLSAQRSLRTSPVLVTQEGNARLGPGYALGAQLSVTQPLLRGAWNDIGLASLRSARISERASKLAATQTASALVRDVLTAYWELWYADQVVRINESSRDLAREQARQAEEQVKSGSLAPADALTFTTRSAELDETVLASTTDRYQRALGMGLLLGDPARAPGFVPSDSPEEPTPSSEPIGSTLAQALTVSPELAELEQNVALAEQQLKIAGDALRPRLDLDASVGVAGLGNQRLSPAFEQVGGLEAVSAHVGLTFEAPLNDQRRQSQVASARYASQISQKQLEATRQRLQNDVLTAFSIRNTALERMKVTRETVRVAEQQAEAERQRFLAGASIAITVQQAEDSLRQARLRLERARVDWTQAEIDLAHLSGRLLDHYQDALARLNEPTTG
jgi:outer membrane protein TolC